MKYNPSNLQKQAGKVTKPTIVGSGASSAVATQKDTDFYQILGHNDYVQDNGSK